MKESSIAVVQPQKASEEERRAGQENGVEKVEVIKVYCFTWLKIGAQLFQWGFQHSVLCFKKLIQARPDRTQSAGMLTDEVAQIQEVRD